jgi:uncharacterized protein YlxW (UPF0749 family)
MMTPLNSLRATGLACTALTFVFLAVAVPAAHAADPPAKKSSPRTTAKSKPNLLTREQLRVCLEEQDQVQQGAARVKQDEASLDQTRAEIERTDADIARRLAALDPADVATRQALSEEESRRNQLADTYNTRLRELREQAGALNAQRAAWLERCSNKDYDERDEFAIKRERQRAAGSAK